MGEMKIIFHMGHPAHFHLFKNAINELKQRNHKILITAFKKDVLIKLLKKYNYSFITLGGKKIGIVHKILNLIETYLKLIKIIQKFKPDLTVSIGSPYIAPVAKLFGAKNIAFNDSEPVAEQRLLYLPFTDHIATPSCFKLDLGKKQLRYEGYHELAYLHPNWFEPDPTVLDKLGITVDDKYVIIRFVSWAASHDVGQVGLSYEEKIKLVKEINRYAIPMITSEGELPKSLEKYRIKLPPHLLQNALYYATLYFGDSQTMATEAAILGVPSIRCNSFADSPNEMANFIELENKFHLLYNFNIRNINKAIDKVRQCIKIESLKDDWRKKKKKLIKAKIDVTLFMIWLIENYPKSIFEFTNTPNLFHESIKNNTIEDKK